MVAAPYDTLVVHGLTKSYVKVAQSGNRRAQAFCPECGTPLWATAPENPTSVIVRLGCVKQRARFRPAVQIWQHSAMPWVKQLVSIPGFQEQQCFLPVVPPAGTA